MPTTALDLSAPAQLPRWQATALSATPGNVHRVTLPANAAEMVVKLYAASTFNVCVESVPAEEAAIGSTQVMVVPASTWFELPKFGRNRQTGATAVVMFGLSSSTADLSVTVALSERAS